MSIPLPPPPRDEVSLARIAKSVGAPSPKVRRQRDLFGGFMDGLYPGIAPDELTSDEKGRINRAVKGLPASATREQVTAKCHAWQKAHPDLDVSPQAITGNWNRIRERRTTATRTYTSPPVQTPEPHVGKTTVAQGAAEARARWQAKRGAQ